MSERLKALSDAGVSIWLDDLSRERIETGNLTELVKDKSVVGVTTNPTIFAGALAEGERYDDQVRALAAQGADVDPDALIAYCREHIAAYKCPKTVDVVDELPRNLTGKILKKQLREPYWQGRERTIV
jgi:transaldolase